ncbi:NrpR regulatory domain-containing protein [Haloferacaceae archaeon DSL9]
MTDTSDPSETPRTDLDRRTYDLLRLIQANEPIGSIRLVTLMQQYGYSIKGRTIRLLLSDLDDEGLTAKVPGKGRKLTDDGRAELERGDVDSRLEHVRERIATLTSQVTFDPNADAGDIVVGTAWIDADELETALDVLAPLAGTPLAPIALAVDPVGDGDLVELAFPSSITLDGVLLSNGINSMMTTAGLVEYRAEASDRDGAAGGRVVRYIDAISGEGSTLDIVSLLFEAGRTDVSSVCTDGTGVLIVDHRHVPMTRYQELYDVSAAVQSLIGGVLDIRRPRERGALQLDGPGWGFASLTYSGTAEVALALLAEHDLLSDWETLAGVRSRADFDRYDGDPGSFTAAVDDS